MKNKIDFNNFSSLFFRNVNTKKGKLIRSTNDANIDYFSDFKIMRFGVVGVKVWFQIKKRKPYFYRFSFLLLCITFLTLILGKAAAKQKNSTKFITKNNNKLLTIKKRGMLSRTSVHHTPLTSQPKNYLLIFQDTKQMSEFLRGNWTKTSKHYPETTYNGITHETVLHKNVFTKSGYHQLNNAVTSNPNCYKNDPTVIAVTPLALSLLNGTKPHKSEFAAWKITYVTSEEAWANFQINSLSLPENEFNLLRTMQDIMKGALYIKPGYENICVFREIQRNELYSIFLEIKFLRLPLRFNNTKQLYFPEPLMTIIPPCIPNPIPVKPHIIDLAPSDYSVVSQVITVEPNLPDLKESEENLTESSKTQVAFEVSVIYQKNTVLGQTIDNLNSSTAQSKKGIADVSHSSNKPNNVLEIYTKQSHNHTNMIKNFYKEKNEKNQKNHDEDVNN